MDAPTYGKKGNGRGYGDDDDDDDYSDEYNEYALLKKKDPEKALSSVIFSGGSMLLFLVMYVGDQMRRVWSDGDDIDITPNYIDLIDNNVDSIVELNQEIMNLHGLTGRDRFLKDTPPLLPRSTRAQLQKWKAAGRVPYKYVTNSLLNAMMILSWLGRTGRRGPNPELVRLIREHGTTEQVEFLDGVLAMDRVVKERDARK